MSLFKPIAALALGAALAFGMAGAAAAQDSRKKRQAGSDEQSAAQKKSNSGYPRCQGLFFTGTRCQLSDGRVCEIAEGTGGRAELINCN